MNPFLVIAVLILPALGLVATTAVQRINALEARVRYLEKVIAPNDPDGLLEDPDLYQDESERKRFYRLWERTECGA